MLRRLFIGVMLGLLVGGSVAAAIVAGLKVTSFVSAGGGPLAFAAAALTGVLTGLVAGKPIWLGGARIEAGLKAFFGALISMGLMFALREWAGSWSFDLRTLGIGGPGPIGDLPGVALPAIAALLGGFFELDNSGGTEHGGNKAELTTPRKRVTSGANGGLSSRPGNAGLSSTDEEAEITSKSAKR